ncbi:hypothetical protein GCM10018781_03370 [Kitasatospora indigofera]|uniref:CBS domain-containing protein n=1 Tax=Kitasatospora indigofera TaxID=67307 RepID=A0A919FB98_9ACTN|nr:hypothetical protein GCM10018781_03370 [Kitasatospora indigofera]
MNHSMLDGAPAESFAHAGTGRVLGRAPVRDWMSRPVVAVVPASDFATMVTAITVSRRGVLPVLSPDGAPVGVVAATAATVAQRTRTRSPERGTTAVQPSSRSIRSRSSSEPAGSPCTR